MSVAREITPEAAPRAARTESSEAGATFEVCVASARMRGRQPDLRRRTTRRPERHPILAGGGERAGVRDGHERLAHSAEEGRSESARFVSSARASAETSATARAPRRAARHGRRHRGSGAPRERARARDAGGGGGGVRHRGHRACWALPRSEGGRNGGRASVRGRRIGRANATRHRRHGPRL